MVQVRPRTLLMLTCCTATVLVLSWQPVVKGQALPFFFYLQSPQMLVADLPDPLPLQRVVVSPENVSTELEKARQGVLVQLSRDDFEARVKQAARAGEAIKKPPRLVEARYRAMLRDTALVGTGEWTVINSAPAAGILALAPFNLALRGARLDKDEAILGELDGKNLGLLVEKSGKHRVIFDWSARGDLETGDLRFKLDVPPCALTSFELELPVDRVIDVSRRDRCLLSGPWPSAVAQHHRWRLDCPAFSPIDLVIRQASGPSQPLPLVSAYLQTRQSLTPDRLEADFTFNLEVWHGSVRELIFECDPSLRALRVRILNREVETWEQRPGKTPGEPSSLLIRLGEPFQGQSLSLTVHCLAPVLAGKRWSCPGLRLADAVLRGESLSLQIAPEVRLENWQPGDFELIKAVAEATGGQTLTFQSVSRDPGLPPAAEPRPRGRIRVQGPEFRVRQLAWWQVTREGDLLTAELAYEVDRGQLFRLPVLLPPGWRVQQVDSAPQELLRHWTVLPAENGRETLIVHLLYPLEPMTPGQLTVQLRVPPDKETPEARERMASRESAFPLLAPRGTRYVEGALGISLDPSFRATISASLPAASSQAAWESERMAVSRSRGSGRMNADADSLISLFSRLGAPSAARSPWGTQPLDYYFPFRGQAVTGTLSLRPRHPRVGAQCLSEVVLASGRAALRTRVLLRPEVGNPDTFDFSLSAPVPGAWSWKSESGRNEVRSVQRLEAVEMTPRLLPLGAGSALEAATLFALPARQDTVWRGTLVRPLQEPLALELSFDLDSQVRAQEIASRMIALANSLTIPAAPAVAEAKAGARDRQWQVPLVTVLGADRMVGEARLHLTGIDRVQVDATGMQEIAPDPQAGPASVWRSYRYGHAPAALVLRGQVMNAEPPELALANFAQLTTYVDPAGRLLHYYRFQVQNWRQRILPLRLPKEARLLVAKVDGRWISCPEPAETAEDCLVVALPVAAAAASQSFEVVYSVEVPAWKLWAVVEAPPPLLPVRTATFRRSWCLPPGLLPLHRDSFHHLSESAGRSLFAGNNPAADVPRAPAGEAPFPVEEWEPLAGSHSEEALIVVRQDGVPVLAGSLTALLLLITWRARRYSCRWRYRLLLIWLASASLAWLWLPGPMRGLAGWPLLAGVALAVLWYLWSALARPAPAAAASAVASAFLALVCAAALPGQAAAPETYLVRILPGPSGSPGKQSALVSPELLDLLQTLTRRGAQGLHGACLLGARYEGTIADGSGEFKADFRVQSFTEDPHILKLPLGSVELEEAALDGAAAYPEALPPPEIGYALRLRGRGLHRIQLRFAVRVGGTGDDQELRFTIPELAQSQLLLTAPAGAKYLQDVLGQGAQRVTPDAKGVHLEADLGRIKAVQVRWLQEKSQPQPLLVQVSEVYLWNLKAGADRLLGILQYTVSQGAAATFAITLPDEMEVRRVEVAPLQGGGPAPHLKEWRVTGPVNRHQLVLEFQVPITNGVQVFLDLVPRKPLGTSIVLPLPTPEGVSFAAEGFLGYRVEGRQAELVQYQGVTGFNAEEFAIDWQSAGVDDPGPPERAYRFQRGPGAAPLLRLNFHLPRSHASCTQELTWYVGPRRAELHALARLKASAEALMMVEWEVPVQVRVGSLSGPNVRSWSRTGSRVQVWLQRSLAGAAVETVFELYGWLTPTRDQPIIPFHLPSLHITAAAPQWTLVRVMADRGLALEASDLQNLWPVPDVRPSPADRAYVSKETVYGGTFAVLPAAADAEVRILTLAEVDKANLTFTATLDFHVRQGELHTFSVRLRNWEGPDVRVEAARVAGRREQRKDLANRAWTLDLEPGVTGLYQVKLTGRQPLEAAGEALMPEVIVDGAAMSERWLAVAGRQPLAEEERGLTAAADPVAALAGWPGAAARLQQAGGSAWKIDAEDWKLRLRTLSPQKPARPIQVFLDEQSAAILDGRHWMHQSAYWLYHEAGNELLLHLPDGARLVRLTLDGNELAPLQFGPEQFWLPLTGGGLRSLQLSWVFEESCERLDRPDLRKPLLDDVVYVAAEKSDATLWTVYLPAGYRLFEPGAGALPNRAAALDLRRAEALLQLSGVFAERLTAKAGDPAARRLALVQELFYRSCRSAESRLAMPEPLGEGRRGDQDLAARLQQLEEANQHLAQKQRLEAIRREAERQARASRSAASGSGEDVTLRRILTNDVVWMVRGTPTYWTPGAGSLVPHLQLVAVQFQQTQQALALSGLVLLLILIGWLLSYFPRLVSWLQALWPEQLAALGGLGWLLLEPNLLFALPVILGVGARLTYLLRWGLAAWKRSAPSAGSIGTGMTSAT